METLPILPTLRLLLLTCMGWAYAEINLGLTNEVNPVIDCTLQANDLEVLIWQQGDSRILGGSLIS